MPSQDKKWRHHYVWQHYLKAWYGDDNLLCVEERGSRRRATTKSIAYGRDFYRLKDIPEAQLALLEALVAKMGEPFRELARGWFPTFRAVFKLQRLATVNGITDPELEREFDVALSNLEEDLHGRFEQSAVKPLAALRRGDATPLQDKDEFMEFSMFLALQYFRTPKLQSSVLQVFQEFGIDMSSAWGLMRTIFATNVGGALYRGRSTFKIGFLSAGKSSSFITGDQPMLNLKGTDGLDLYYPLTPRSALRITLESVAPGVEEVSLTDDETKAYNERIRAAAESQLYAQLEEHLLAR